MDFISIYHLLPRILQNYALSAYSILLQKRYYGDGFSQWSELLEHQEYWTLEEINEYQINKAHELINLASRHVPYYRQAYSKLNRNSIKIESFADLHCLPILEKEIIRIDATQLLDERLNKKALIKDRTSGSTGTPLIIYWPKDMFPKFWSLMERRVRAWAGVSQVMPRTMIGGRSIVKGKTNGPYWRYNYLWKQLYMSSYHISSQTANDYIEAIDKYNSQWITGYGSAIAILGEWLINQSFTLPRIHSILTSGDNLILGHRQNIEKGFDCKVYDNYGSAEASLIISECVHGRLHVQPECGILEILDKNGQPCKPGYTGEIIATGLLNDAMPLIRYRTGDMASWAKEKKCPCGRNSPIVDHIDGRSDDYLQLEDGRRIGRLSTAIKKSLTIKNAQIVQDRIDHAWLMIHPARNYSQHDGELIKEDILSKIGNFNIDVFTTDYFPKTPVGKQRLVVRSFDKPNIAKLYENIFPSN